MDVLRAARRRSHRVHGADRRIRNKQIYCAGTHPGGARAALHAGPRMALLVRTQPAARRRAWRVAKADCFVHERKVGREADEWMCGKPSTEGRQGTAGVCMHEQAAEKGVEGGCREAAAAGVIREAGSDVAAVAGRSPVAGKGLVWELQLQEGVATPACLPGVELQLRH